MRTGSFTLRQRMFFLVGGAVAGALAIIWLGIRPPYQHSFVEERTTVIQQFLDYVRATADERLARDVSAVTSVVREIASRPADADNILRTTMGLDPSLLEIRVSAAGSDQDLVARQVGAPVLDLAAAGPHAWHTSMTDSAVEATLILDHPSGLPLIVLRRPFSVGSVVFTASLIWNASYLPEATERSTQSAGSAALWFSDSMLTGTGAARSMPPNQHRAGRMASMKTVTIEDEEWILVVSPFETLPLTLSAAVSQDVLLAPVQDLFLISIVLIVGTGSLILLIAWRFTAAITRPIEILAREVTRLTDLDFSQPVSPPLLPELRRMGESIETMRSALERYQRINVERIIVEEWKTRTLMTHGDDGIGITDGTGVFVFRNKELDSFWADLTPAYSLRKLSELLKDDRVTVRSETEREERTDDDRVMFRQKEIVVRPNDRTEHHVRLKIVELERYGEPIGSMVILHDLTEDRKIDQMRNDMINVIVHEMRNPAGGIRGIAEVLQDADRMEAHEVKEFILHIYDAAQRLLDLINRFLDIQRLESGTVDHPKQRIDISKMIDAVVLSQKPYLMEKRLTMDVRKPDALEVPVAPELMRDALQNLLSNAIKYGEAERTIEIEARTEEDRVIIAVTDNGYGIPVAEQEKLFTKFFRVRSNRAAAKQVGTGLGLAYVKEIMTHHGGSVEFVSEPSFGCRFSLNFPLKGKT